MQRGKTIPLFLNAFFLLSSPLFSQETVTEVLTKYSKAIGGQGEIARVKNIYSLAECTGPNGAYQTEIFSANDTLTVFRQSRKNKPDYTGSCNGEYTWTSNPEPEPAGEKEAFAWRSHELQWIALHPSGRFCDLHFAGTASFAGKQAIKLSAADERNKPAELFFDSKTFLLLGFSIESPFSEKPVMIRLQIQEWKRAGKLLLPAKVVFTDEQGDFILNFHTIKINQTDQRKFSVPPTIIAMKELMALHRLQRTAHFNRDARLLVSQMSDDFTEISKGRISHPQKEELTRRFQGYFDAVTCLEWDDIRDPVIRISEDASMAYMLVNKRVRLKTSEGKEELTIFAWTSTFRKINGNWQMTSIASTTAEPAQ